MTKLRWFQLFVKSQNSNFKLFWKKKNQILGFLWCSIRENLSIDVSITNVGLILTKLRWFQLFVKRQISNSFEKKNQILGFLFCSTREDHWRSYDDIFSRGADRRTDRRTDRQTDTVLESSYGNMSAHKKFQLKAQN